MKKLDLLGQDIGQLNRSTLAWLLSALFMVGLVTTVWSVPALAQAAGATLSGLLQDPSGGVVPDASISIRNTGTGEVRQNTSNTGGFYSAPNLQPGSYEVTVTAKGFRGVSSMVTLNVGAQQELNFTLKIGDVNQSVEVQA